MRKLFLFLLLAPFFCLAQSEQNLLLHYKFDGNALDQTENEYHGIPNNITYTTDRFGNENAAALFNGVDSFVDFPNISELKPQLPVSFAFWIRYDSDLWQDREVFNTSHEDDKSSGVFFNSQAETGKYGVSYGDGSDYYNQSSRRTYDSNHTIQTGEWVHITIVVEGPTNMKIYTNCKEEGGTYSGEGGDLYYSATPGSFGRHDRDLTAPPNYFKGAIDEFMYWDRALSESEVSLLCNNLGTGIVKETSFGLYPNPANEYIYLIGEEFGSNTFINFYDTLGKLIFSTPYQQEINVSHLSSGIYFLKIINNTSVITKNLIIRR